MTAAEYAYQAWYLVNARRYSLGANGIKPGDRVEVELNERPEGALPFARGEVLRRQTRAHRWRRERSHVRRRDRRQRAQIPHRRDRRSRPPASSPASKSCSISAKSASKALDDYTIEMQLENPTPFWLELLTYHALLPVNQNVPRNATARPPGRTPKTSSRNGPYRVAFRRIRDRIRLVKNEHYWDPDRAKLNVIDASGDHSASRRCTTCSPRSKVDWITDSPPIVLRELIKSGEASDELDPQAVPGHLLLPAQHEEEAARRRPRPPGAGPRARPRRNHSHRHRLPAKSPPTASCRSASPATRPKNSARKTSKKPSGCLPKPAIPNGRGFPKLEILYNTHQAHQTIAQLVRKQWEKNLGITASTRNEEWGSYQTSIRQFEFDAARRAWIADYIDPNSHLDIMVTDGENNNTGWSNAEYDRLIAAARAETDEAKRFELFHQAERILMDELPIIPDLLLRRQKHGQDERPRLPPQSARPASALRNLDRRSADDDAPHKTGTPSMRRPPRVRRHELARHSTARQSHSDTRRAC